MSETKPTRILMASASFDRVYGGIAICVARLATELAQAGVSVALWAPDGSAITSDLIDTTDGDVIGLGGTLPDALDRFPDPDVIHDHGLWLRHNHVLANYARKNNIPRIVSVHGMLEPWALGHKRMKKMAAWHMYQKRDLQNAQRVHATAEAEIIAIEAAGVRNELVAIPNGTDLPELAADAPTKTDPRIALFLSRIHPKKGLPMLLEAWADLAPRDWQLQIAGPDENGHQSEVEALVQRLNLSSEISFLGPLDGAQVSAAYQSASVFVLPTHSENFGLVVTEALAHQVPVLTTTGAPWEALEHADCGWWVEPTVDGIRDGLKRALGASDERLQKMGQNGRQLVAEKYSWRPIAKAFLNVYEQMIAEAD